MKIIKISVAGLPLFKEKLDINFLTDSRVTVEERHELINLFNRFYINRTLAFTGLNAAGKTQVLNILSFSLKLLQGKSINEGLATYMDSMWDYNPLKINMNGEVTFQIYFYNETQKKIVKLTTIVTKIIDKIDGESKYTILRECLEQKSITGVRTKKQIFEFGEDSQSKVEKQVRNNNNFYLALSHDISMIQVYYNKENEEPLFYSDMLNFTNLNVISEINKYTIDLVKFLDPSIEKLDFKLIENQRNIMISIKFKGNDKIINLNSIGELHTVLSSGTVKGLGVFSKAIQALYYGGIIIVDELENHFNREIAATLIRWFSDRKTNINGAILVYSTHYVELLDTLDRNDAVYIVRKNEKIFIERLSKTLKRTDLSRSTQFIKGVLENTVPDYSLESKIRRTFVSKFNENQKTKESAE